MFQFESYVGAASSICFAPTVAWIAFFMWRAPVAGGRRLDTTVDDDDDASVSLGIGLFPCSF
jgi:hypothetical protein